MNLQVDVERVRLANKTVRAELLNERTPDGHWAAQLASSPFATATAISALVLGHRIAAESVLADENSPGGSRAVEQIVQSDLSELLVESVNWLASRQNPDGGWGDCERSKSTTAATLLVQAAFRLTGIPAKYSNLMARADQYIAQQDRVVGLWREHGQEKPLVAAILANAGLAGMVAWRQVPTLAYETVCLPSRWQQYFTAPAAPYEMPAYMSAGIAKFAHDPPRNPLTRLLRRGLRAKSLTVLESLQAEDGGFADSIPQTAFVVMNLASIGCQQHPLVQRGIEFLLSSVAGNASWCMEGNFDVWNTTLAVDNLGDYPSSLSATSAARLLRSRDEVLVSSHPRASRETAWNALAGSDRAGEAPDAELARQTASTADVGEFHNEELALEERCLNWLLDCQHVQPFSPLHGPAGGWARSTSRGALPDAMATAIALHVLARFCRRFAELERGRIERAASLGQTWLLGLQGDDGGWSLFYGGRDATTFGEATVDATALALRALAIWQRQWQSAAPDGVPQPQVEFRASTEAAIERGFAYLVAQQRGDGSFVSGWFGNEYQPQGHNPVIAAALVLETCAELGRLDSELARRTAQWLATAQHANGGWGPPRAPLDYSGAEKDGFRAWRGNDALAKFCSIEETALAVTALLPFANTSQPLSRAVSQGLAWLTQAIEQDAHRQGAVVSLNSYKLWYHDRLYPLVFASGALSLAARQLQPQQFSAAPVG